MEFKNYLSNVRTRKGKLSPSTIDLYDRYARRWGDDPLGWANSYLCGDVSRGTSCGVVAALRHYCECFNIEFDPHDLPLPNSEQYVRKGYALTPEELDEFFLTLDESGIDDPVFTVLLLLPRTGLRIAEMCTLKRNAVVREGRKQGLRVIGKGGRKRWVPLTKDASRIIRTYIKENKPDGDFLFPSPRFANQSVSPDTVRKDLRELRENLSGVGHATIATTTRYLHPTRDMLADAMATL